MIIFPIPVERIGNKASYKKTELKCYVIKDLNKDCKLYVIHESFEKAFKKKENEIIKKIRNKKLKWLDYFNFKELFADLGYNHALTVHKSQGSTYNNVIINLIDIMKNKNVQERNRLLYTAITRARYKAIFLV